MIIARAKLEIEFTIDAVINDGDRANIYLDDETEPFENVAIYNSEISFQTAYIPDGEHEITVKIIDSAGNESAGISQNLTIVGKPKAPTDIAAIVGDTETVRLTWTKSENDE